MSEYENKSFDFDKLKGQAEAKVKALWAGEVSLLETFWIYYFGVVAGLMILSSAFGVLGIIFYLAALGWAGFMVKPIWLSADKYPGPKHWATIAKVMAVLIGISVIASIF